MALIGTLPATAGGILTLSGQAAMEQFIVCPDVSTATLRSVVVEVDGVPFINIPTAALCNAFSKYTMESVAGVVGFMLTLGTGRVNRSTTIRLTNDTAVARNVFAFSEAGNGVPFSVASKFINPNGFEDFDKFTALFIETPANVAQAQVTFADGYTANMSIQEIDAYFALNNQTDAAGRIGGVSVIDNKQQNIKAVRLFAGASGYNVMVAKIPQAAWEEAKKEAQKLQ